jgi:hypothetical protein
MYPGNRSSVGSSPGFVPCERSLPRQGRLGAAQASAPAPSPQGMQPGLGGPPVSVYSQSTHGSSSNQVMPQLPRYTGAGASAGGLAIPSPPAYGAHTAPGAGPVHTLPAYGGAQQHQYQHQHDDMNSSYVSQSGIGVDTSLTSNNSFSDYGNTQPQQYQSQYQQQSPSVAQQQQRMPMTMPLPPSYSQQPQHQHQPQQALAPSYGPPSAGPAGSGSGGHPMALPLPPAYQQSSVPPSAPAQVSPMQLAAPPTDVQARHQQHQHHQHQHQHQRYPQAPLMQRQTSASSVNSVGSAGSSSGIYTNPNRQRTGSSSSGGRDRTASGDSSSSRRQNRIDPAQVPRPPVPAEGVAFETWQPFVAGHSTQSKRTPPLCTAAYKVLGHKTLRPNHSYHPPSPASYVPTSRPCANTFLSCACTPSPATRRPCPRSSTRATPAPDTCAVHCTRLPPR